MASKIIRSLKFIKDTYNVDNEFWNICELFGYEIDDAQEHASIIYDRDEDKIVGILGLYAYFCKDANKYLQVQIVDNDATIHIEGYTHTACNIALFLIDESFRHDNSIYVITELQYILIHRYTPRALNIVDTRLDEIDSKVIRRLNNVSYNSSMVKLATQTESDVHVDSDMRSILSSLGYMEILTHTIVNYSVAETPLNLTLTCNKIEGYLSHNYLRESITTSFYFEYQVYKQYASMFEVSDVFNLLNTHKQDSVNIFFCYKRYLHYKLCFTIDCVLSFYGLSARYYFSKKNKYVQYIHYVDTNKKIYCIGIHTVYNDIMCYELYCDMIEDLEHSLHCGSVVYNDINNFTDNNVLDHYNEYAHQSFVADSSILSIKVIDVYKNKYTVRIEKKSGKND